MNYSGYISLFIKLLLFQFSFQHPLIMNNFQMLLNHDFKYRILWI